ncbi:MAG TPA: MqnA/MqnD/SBP family protein [Bacteroidota bacterium]|nr:MqnA/MqnD/SBP family protein [Bacteroidota bacterium]
MPLTLGIPDALYTKPLLYVLGESDPPITVVRDIPAQIALNFSKRIPPLSEGCAFLSPIDYARYGGEYRIVPDVAVSSEVPTGTIQLIIKPETRNISTIAVDIRGTSEIVLAKILLQEKYRNLATSAQTIQFIPMMPDVEAMLKKADAALVMNYFPTSTILRNYFVLDLVEAWKDLTDLPYLHGFWVVREGQVKSEDIRLLIRAREEGVAQMEEIVQLAAQEHDLQVEHASRYFSSFNYDLRSAEHDSLSEFIHYAFFFGVLPDAPDINFFPL